MMFNLGYEIILKILKIKDVFMKGLVGNKIRVVQFYYLIRIRLFM